MPAPHVGGFRGGARPPGAPQQIMPQALAKADEAGKMKSGVTPVTVAQLVVPIVQRPSMFAGHTASGTSSRIVWELPSQLNAVRRVCATMPCPPDSIRISTYCAVASPPCPDLAIISPLFHVRRARVVYTLARSRTGGGRRIVRRKVLLAGDELAATEVHAVALGAHGEEDRDRIGIADERVQETRALAHRLGELALLHDHRLDRARGVREAVALHGARLADRLPAGRWERVAVVEGVAGRGGDAQGAAELRGVAGHDRRVLRDQDEGLLRRLG